MVEGLKISRSRDAIAVSSEVKKGLDRINDQMEEHLGSRLSYNEIVTYLLVQYKKSGNTVYAPSDSQLDLFDKGREVAHSYVKEEATVLEQRSDDKPFEEPYDETV